MKLTTKIFGCFILLSAFLLSHAFSQTRPSNCRVNVSGGRYRWERIAPLLNDPDSYFGYVLIKPTNVNREFMMKLARRLKAKYCNVSKFQVVIFDDEKYANSNALLDYASSKGKTVLMRGFYSFDRVKRKDLIEFSTVRGNPTNEVVIDFANEPDF